MFVAIFIKTELNEYLYSHLRDRLILKNLLLKFIKKMKLIILKFNIIRILRKSKVNTKSNNTKFDY